jgi:TolA-binding protein
MQTALSLMLLLWGGSALAQASPSDATTAIANELGLDAPTATTVAQTIAKYQTQLDPIRQTEQQTAQALQQELAAAQPDPNRLTQLSNQLTSGRQQLEAIETQRLAELQQELTPAQFAKLLLRRPTGRPGRMPPQGAATATPPRQ